MSLKKAHIAQAATIIAMFHTLGCIGDVGDESTEDVENVEETEAPIVNGITTTDYAPVVRISWSKSYSCGFLNLSTCTSTASCTATAIADDLLVTASHCVKDGMNEAGHVKVSVAHGNNSAAQGEYSSYFIMSKDIYDNVNKNDNNSYYYRDFTFVKFGAGTFSEYYDTTYAPGSPNGWTVTKVGFGGDTTKEYTTKTIVSNESRDGGDYRVARTSRDGAYNENGDSGGPLLKWNGSTSKWEVLGVVFGNNGVNDLHPIFTTAMNTNILSKLDTNLPRYCAENYQHTNYGGFSWATCNTGALDNQLDGFSDPFIVRSHWNYGDWNDEMSSVLLPTANMAITYYEHGGQGGSSVTFQNLFDFGDGSVVPNLANEGFNDKISSYRMVSGGSGSTLDWYLEITRYGKCIDTSGSHNVGTNVYQYSCSNGNNNQIFRIESVGSNYRIKHKASGLCLGAENGGTSSGTKIELQTCDNSSKQLYTITSNSSTNSVRDFTIKNPNSGRCLDLSGGSSSNNTPIQLWGCGNTNPSQNFALKRY